jgi:beta-N-acetylhexosaminidase
MKDPGRLTLEEKVGQLFFLGFAGPEPARETREILNTIRPGGIVLSQRNLETFEQTIRLTAGFSEDRDMPAFVAAHQEGGAADRLKHLFAPLPSLGEAASGGTLQLRQAARIIGAELAAAGFNTLFGPLLDLAVPGSILRDRALAGTPASVTRLGRAFVEEVTEHGIFACPKHFPGMGSAQRDSHFELPHIDKPRKQLLVEDVPPFVNLFDAVSMIMVGHAHYPTLGEAKATPACLSPRIVDGLLRRKLGYTGIILTDDMTMGAVSSLGLKAGRFLEAFEAGNDMMVFSQTTPLVEEGFQTIVREAKKSVALRARIDTSVQRIVSQKFRIQPAIQNRAYARTRVLRHIEKLTPVLAKAAAAEAPSR